MSHAHRRRSKTYRPRTLAEAISRDPLPQHRQDVATASPLQVDTTTTAYLKTSVRLPQGVYSFIEEQARHSPHPDVARRMVYHIVASQLLDERDLVPVPFSLLSDAATTRTADVWEAIPALRHVRARIGQKTRRFYIDDEYLTPLFEVITSRADDEDWVDIEGDTSSPTYKTTALTYLDTKGRSQNWNRQSALMHATLSHYKEQRDYIDMAATVRHLKRLHAVAAELVDTYKAYGRDGADRRTMREAYVATRSAVSRYLSDRQIVETIRGQDLRHEEGDIYSFVQVVRPEYTGRLSPICSLTGASSGLKAAASQGTNVDIKSSQTELLRVHIREAEGFDKDITPLLDMPDKDHVAERFDVTRKRVKIVEHSIKFGASCKARDVEAALKSAYHRARTTIEEHDVQLERWQTREEQVDQMARKRLPTIVRTAYEWSDLTGDPAQEIYDELVEIYGPTAQLLDAYGDWLLDVWYPRHESYGHVKNACGMRFYIREDEEGYEYKTSVSDWAPISRRKLKAKLAAFRLQGGEAAFIHHLTLLGSEYGYKVLRNEHDGAIVIGSIPEEAIEKARQASGFTTARLEEKPFDGTFTQKSKPLPPEVDTEGCSKDDTTTLHSEDKNAEVQDHTRRRRTRDQRGGSGSTRACAYEDARDHPAGRCRGAFCVPGHDQRRAFG